MYFPDSGTKSDPVRRWRLTERVFFGHGACHILAGAFLRRFASVGFFALRLEPMEGYPGTHVFVVRDTDAFDYHGWTHVERLLAHLRRGWSQRAPGWDATVEIVDFDLLDTAALNPRNLRGPEQFLHDPLPRADAFIDRFLRYAPVALHGGGG